MSTLSISPAFQPMRTEHRFHAGQVRLTRRGRVVTVVAFLLLALAAMLAMGGWATATLGGGSPAQVRYVQVQPGDTLYGIAGEYAAPGEIRSMVREIRQLNSLPGASIAEGQRLAVPVD